MESNMTFKASFLAATALSLCLAAAPSSHAQLRPDPGQIFDTSDANSDGKITRDEFRGARAKTFGKLDRNSDGFVDEKDKPRRLRARQQDDERMAALRKELDTDGDGRVSRAEFDSGPMPAFERADANKDGELDADEIAAAKAAAKQLRAARKG
jgi:hypothetical protein